MRLRILITLFFVIVITTTFFVFLNMYFENEEQHFKSVFKDTVETHATEIYYSHFRNDELYNAILRWDDQKLNMIEENLKKSYPFIVDVEFETGNPPETIYSITSSGTLLVLEYRISNSSGKTYIPDKIAKVLVDVSSILKRLHLENVRIATGTKEIARDLTYGLKYERLLKISELPIILSFAFILLIALMSIVSEISVIKELRKEEILNNALNSVIKLTQDMLIGNIELSYQLILEKAIEIIPRAQSGSVLMKEGDIYRFVATAGYNFEELSKVWFFQEELAQGMDAKVKITTNLQEFDAEVLKGERFQILNKYGRIDEIKAMLSVPIVVNNEIVAFMNIDNLESSDAFNEFAVRIATLFATQIGVVFEKLKLEEELIKQKEMLEILSTQDALTQLPNRRALEMEAEKITKLAEREGKNICVVYVDLFKFKAINDSFGHRVGDYILKVVAERLQSVVRKSDFIARIGGDEFVFLLYDCKEYKQFVERTLQEIEKDIVWESHVFNVSANFGIAIYPHDGTDFGDLLIKADMAMYYAKNSGKSYHLASQLSTDSI